MLTRFLCVSMPEEYAVENNLAEVVKHYLDANEEGRNHILSSAAIALIFTVIALPVSFAVPVRGGAPLGTGLSIILALVFWTMFSLSLSLGYAGVIPPPVAAWAAQVLFLFLGMVALMMTKHPRLH